MNTNRIPSGAQTALIGLAVCLAGNAARIEGATIGVLRLSDARQYPNLSLLDPAMSAARNALVADGHLVTQVNAIDAASLGGIRILWLPLLETDAVYTAAERDALRAFFDGGGRILWVGDAGIYNSGDDSFLSAFGISKLDGTYSTTGPVFTGGGHALANGPFGSVGLVAATNATFGLMNLQGANVPATALYTEAAGPGAFAAVLDASSGGGRAGLVCDSSIFADLFDDGAGHRTFLRNLVAWLGSDSNYTPKGMSVSVGPLTDGCAACVGISVEYSEVTTTGLTSVTSIGTGARCGFDLAPFGGLALRYAGFGFQLASTAVIPAGSAATLTVSYSDAALHEGGFRDDSGLELFWFNTATGTASAITTHRDPIAKTVSGSTASLPSGGGAFLLGRIIPATDCNGNGTPDVCEIESASLAPGGPYYCVSGCDADCNENGMPDACDVRTRHVVTSSAQGPIGAGAPGSFLLARLPAAVGSVTLEVTARGDFSAESEYLDVRLNGTWIGRVFENGGLDCPAAPVTASISVTSAAFNASLGAAGGSATILLTASSAVDANLCDPPSSAQIRLDYEAESGVTDCNSNGIPDECESAADCDGNGVRDLCDIAAGVATDCNGNGVPDSCDIASETSADCNANEIPDDCEGPIALTMQRVPEGGGAVHPSAGGQYTVCEPVSITASAASGFCFAGWTVDTGAQPIDPAATATAVIADFPKTVTASFTRIISGEPEDVAACLGDEVRFTVLPDESLDLGSATFQWRRNGVALDGAAFVGAATHELLIPSVESGHVGFFDCVVTLPCGSAVSRAAVLSIRGDTSIVTDPSPQRAACIGETVTLFVEAAGVDNGYQWQYASDQEFADLTDSADTGVGGAQTAILTLAGVQPIRSGRYRCVVSGACGAGATSGETHLTVRVPAAIVNQTTDETLCEGQTFTGGVTATGSDLLYEWWFNGNGTWRALLPTEAGVSGVSTPTLTIANVSASHAGAYRCLVTGGCGMTAQSSSIQLAVRPATRVFDGPSQVTACPGQGVSLTATATGVGLMFQWQFDGGSGFADIDPQSGLPGVNGETLTIPQAASVHAGAYRCVVTGECGAALATSPTLLHVPGWTTNDNFDLPSDASACPGGMAVFEAVASGSNLSYQWQAHTGAAFQSLQNGPNVSGAQSSILVLTGVSAQQAGRYHCVIIGQCGQPLTTREAHLTLTSNACDCNANGVDDGIDIANGVSADCNSNGVPDECEIPAGSGAPGGPFHCTVGCTSDCNGNGLPDSCDIAAGMSADCNANGIPDECETDGGGMPDCNQNGIPDVCDIANGTSEDCNRNGIPDECDPPYMVSAGPAMQVCAGQATVQLGGAIVASGSTPPYTYQWQIVSGPGGASLISPTAMRPTFQASQTGVYEVRVTVRDSTQPPCVKSDTTIVTVYGMSVDAGPDRSIGFGGSTAPLTPSVGGAVGTVTYQWQVEPGAPSLSPAQFTGGGATASSPTFTPALPGRYVLRVTAMDSNTTAACSVSDTVTVDSVLMTLGVPADFSMCVAGVSAPLAVSITSPGVPPYSYAWQVESGSPNVSQSQFGGDGPLSSRPTFTPASAGEYSLRVTVRDSSTPVSEVSRVIRVSAGAMNLALPAEVTTCIGSGGVRLPRPTLVGGNAPVYYNWTVESDSPGTMTARFADENAFDPSWLFIPEEAGSYTLRLTATDSASPACSTSGVLAVRATKLSVDAGGDFVTPAFSPSKPLGPASATSGGAAIRYEWRVLAGPSLDASQFSDPTLAHPVFTPGDVGSYALQVTGTDPVGGCASSDVVAIEAIAASRAMQVNMDGRVFMSLRIAEAHEAAEVRVAGAAPGEGFAGSLRDAGGSADRSGLLSDASIDRRLTIDSTSRRGDFVMVVGMLFDLKELASADAIVRVHQWDGGAGKWRPAVDGAPEAGPYPPRPMAGDVGRGGVQSVLSLGADVRMAWVVVDRAGEFAIGVSEATAEPFPPGGPAGSPAPGLNPGGGLSFAPVCGGGTMAASGMLLPLMLLSRVRFRRRC
ncbi:MAG: hypothetical protein KF841_03340 [Phycisphaerae bacterium]|nr:hypothetical protein [Phycisphaerae bacterium]